MNETTGDKSRPGGTAGEKMRRFLTKVVSFVLVLAGMLLGLCCAYFCITSILRSQHIRISLGHPDNEEKPDSDLIAGYNRYTPSPHAPRKKHSSRSVINIDNIDSPDELMKIAIQFIQDEDYYYAEEALNKIQKLKPDYPELYYFTGLCKEKEDDAEEAIKAYAEYKKSPGCDPSKLLHIADFLISNNRGKEALGYIQDAQKVKDSPEAHYLTARCHFLAKNYTKSIEESKKTLEYDKNYPSVYVLLADSYEKSKKIQEAIYSYQEAYRLEPKPEYLYKSGLLAGEVADYKNAKIYMNNYIASELDPEKQEEARAILKEMIRNSMKTIPAEVESRTDFIPNVSVVGIMKTEDSAEACLKIDGQSQLVQEGETILDSYYVLAIRESHIVLIHDEEYVVLRPL